MKKPETICNLLLITYNLLLTTYLYGFSFLKISLGAKPSSLGECYTAQADDLNTIEFNPAGIARIYRLQALATYIKYYEDISLNSIAFGLSSMKGKAAFAYGFYIISVDDIARAKDSITPLGNISFSDTLHYFGYGVKLHRDIFFGTALKITSERLRAVTLALPQQNVPILADFGLLFLRPARADAYGISIQNIELIDREKDFIPTIIRLGTSAKLGPVTFLSDLNLYRSYAKNEYIKYRIGLGVDYSLTEFLKLRLGAKYLRNIDLTFGFGFNWRDIYLDYAFLAHVDLGDTHRFSLGVKF